MSVVCFAAFRSLGLLGLFLLSAALPAAAAEHASTGDQVAEETAPNSIRHRTDLVDVNASWPVLGIARVDDESQAFVEGQVESFERETLAFAEDLKAFVESRNEEDSVAHLFPYELLISHEATYPSPRVACILWNVWSYTGGAHGLLDIVANNYDRSTGYPLLLEDLFVDPELAVLQFSKAARRDLAEPDEGEEDGSGFPDEMLMAGTEPVEDNFRTFIVTPNGIRVHFQPYQVAPWAAGPQTVDVSLDELKGAKPRLEYWEAVPSAS